MGINASAHRVHVPQKKQPPPFNHVKHSRFLQPQQQVILRPLTPEELRAPCEKLPELHTSSATRLMLSLMEPFRKREGVDYEDPEYYETLAFSTIAHEEFVQAHCVLTYFSQNYTEDRCAFEAARDFIRECALNNYYATYG